MTWVIDMLAGVRHQTGRDVRLHLVGPRYIKVSDEGTYYRVLRNLVEANSTWVFLHEDLPKSDLFRLLGNTRYGIHAQIDEHFGIAPAEMVTAGCITFVHNSGGQVEIVGRQEQLIFTSEEEAAMKISRVLSDPGLQASLRAALEPRRTIFSTSRFEREIRNIVAEFLDQRAQDAADRSSSNS